MRSTFVDFKTHVFDQPGRKYGRWSDWDDLVVVAVDDERRHIDFLQILRKIRFGEQLNTIVDRLVTSLHALQPEGIAQALRHLRIRSVHAVERRAEIFE